MAARTLAIAVASLASVLSQRTAASRDMAGPAADILRVTGGAHVRVVWCRSVVAGQGDVDATKPVFSLVVFDTASGAERVLVGGPRSCANPLITGDGSGVVFSEIDNQLGKVWAVDWDGSNLREVCAGFAPGIWRDPATGVQWILVGNNYAQGTNTNQSTVGVDRVRLDDPSVRQAFWNSTHVEQRAFVSRDGTRMGSGFPWNHQGVANLVTGQWQEYGQGCNPSIAPDNSYRFFYMVGSHTEIIMYDAGAANRRVIPVNYKPGGMFWNPKWTNHVRFLTVAGPFSNGFNNAPGSHIHIGRFDEAFAKVEEWAQVSDGPVRDTHGYAWIETPETRNSREAEKRERLKAKHDLDRARTQALAQARKQAAEERAARKLRKDAVFLWEARGASAIALDRAGAPIQGFAPAPRGVARYTRDGAMDLTGGAFVAEKVSDFVLSSCRQSGKLTLEAGITPARLSTVGQARIVTFATDDGGSNFALAQDGSHLVFRLKTTDRAGEWVRLFALAEGAPTHVVVSYRRGRLVCYRDGKLAYGNMDAKGSLGSWKPGRLVFGDDQKGAGGWDGSLENVAIHATAMGAADAARSCAAFASRVAGQTPAPRLEVEARLVAKSVVPALKKIAPYFQALAVYEYEVRRVVSGTYDGKKLRVAHWGLMDRKRLPIAESRIGSTRRLVLEPFSENPQLQPELLSNTLDADFELELYYDVGPIETAAAGR